jgi:hypothetical protein
MGIILLALACLTEARDAPGQAPSTLLLHARLAEALTFAAQTARQRGWTLVESGPASMTFEQSLDQDPDGSVALLRITASGAESPGGVTLSLAAREVRPTEGRAEDVTQRYRDNLVNALDSLASKWGLRPGVDAGALGSPTAPAPQARVARLPILAPAPTLAQPKPIAVPAEPLRPQAVPTKTSTTHSKVGTWAYYAEHHAQLRGCTLGDLGAVLEDQVGGDELHRVFCADGRQVLVRCVAGSCADAR